MKDCVVLDKPKIMVVYGTRPEAIKVAPVIDALSSAEDLDCIVAVTGQHREMLDQVNKLFGIEPAVDLNIMKAKQTLNEIFARTLQGLDSELNKFKPDAVMVQGDTTTSTAAAVAAFNRGIPVLHLEAGLRSGNIASPFPEEANRRLTSQISALHLAPTTTSEQNLIAEGIDPATVVVTGNTVIDALLVAVNKEVRLEDSRIQSVVDSGRRIVLVTTHRRENQGAGMENVGRALAALATRYPDVAFVLPAHKNPVVREAVLPHLLGIQNFYMCEPLSYGEFTSLLSKAHLVLTDSGGVQEEAPSLGKPVLVMRENTERPEALAAGTVELVGTNRDSVVNAVSRLLDDDKEYGLMANAVNPYGDGLAARRTLAAIRCFFGIGERMPNFAETVAAEGNSAVQAAH